MDLKNIHTRANRKTKILYKKRKWLKSLGVVNLARLFMCRNQKVLLGWLLGGSWTQND